MRQTYREYATDAFRFLAREGSAEKYIAKIVEDIMRKQRGAGIASPTEAALIHKEAAIRDKAAELADLEAAEKVYSYSSKETRQAIEIVYFADCWRNIERGEIGERIHKAELWIPASERDIYRWLSKARRDFAVERGLRI